MGEQKFTQDEQDEGAKIPFYIPHGVALTFSDTFELVEAGRDAPFHLQR